MERKHWWRWVCEFCFKQINNKILPSSWDLVWQSAVCPCCKEKVAKNGGYGVVKCGSFAPSGRSDPRARQGERKFTDS